MFGMGMGELIVILIVALLFLGPDKLPGMAKAVGKGIRELRRHTRDLEDTLERDAELGSTVRELKSALRGEDFPRMTARIQPGAADSSEKTEPEAKPEPPAAPPKPEGPVSG